MSVWLFIEHALPYFRVAIVIAISVLLLGPIIIIIFGIFRAQLLYGILISCLEFGEA